MGGGDRDGKCHRWKGKRDGGGQGWMGGAGIGNGAGMGGWGVGWRGDRDRGERDWGAIRMELWGGGTGMDGGEGWKWG